MKSLNLLLVSFIIIIFTIGCSKDDPLYNQNLSKSIELRSSCTCTGGGMIPIPSIINVSSNCVQSTSGICCFELRFGFNYKNQDASLKTNSGFVYTFTVDMNGLSGQICIPCGDSCFTVTSIGDCAMLNSPCN